jgi:hypothetical protein
MPELVLGPVLRYVDATEATVWVETDAACEVEILGCTERTFHVAGHHYAIVHVTGWRRTRSTRTRSHSTASGAGPTDSDLRPR